MPLGSFAPLDPQLAQTINSGAASAEANGRLDDAVVHAMIDAGLYRQWIAPDYGGTGVDAVGGLGVMRAVSSQDGAAGWCLMIASTTSMLSYLLPAETAAEVYGHSTAITGGFAVPRGTAVDAGDGTFSVNGTWQWGSGTAHCTHIGGGCLVVDAEGKPTGRAPFVLFDRNDVELLDTWHVSGLSGTGSTDYRVDDLSVAHGRAVDLGATEPTVEATLARISFFGLLAAGVAAVTIGIAERAIAELVDLAGGKIPQGSGKPLAKRQTTQIQVAKAIATVESAWGYLADTVASCAAEIERTGSNSDDQRLRLRLAATDAAQRCGEVVRELYLVGGGEAVYRRNALQKQFRDIHVATQHAMVAPRTYELAGRFGLGLETDFGQI